MGEAGSYNHRLAKHQYIKYKLAERALRSQIECLNHDIALKKENADRPFNKGKLSQIEKQKAKVLLSEAELAKENVLLQILEAEWSMEVTDKAIKDYEKEWEENTNKEKPKMEVV